MMKKMLLPKAGKKKKSGKKKIYVSYNNSICFQPVSNFGIPFVGKEIKKKKNEMAFF